MKAVIYSQPGGPEVLTIGEVAEPTLQDDELLIRVEVISIEGGDLVTRQRQLLGQDEVLGYAAAGEVLEVGSAVQGFKRGQKVVSFAWRGSHAERRAVSAATSFLVPEGLDLQRAAAIPVGPATAAWVMQLGRLSAGQTVLITGAAGGVGVAAVQLAAKLGARVIGTGTRPDSLEKLRAYGLDDAIVVGERDANEQVRALLGGEGVDLLIDNVGGASLVDGLAALKEGGSAVLVGVLGAASQPIDAVGLLMQRKTVIGCLFGPEMETPAGRAIVDAVLQRVAAGDLQVPIDAVYPFAEAAEAHRHAETRGRIGRVLMTL